MCHYSSRERERESFPGSAAASCAENAGNVAACSRHCRTSFASLYPTTLTSIFCLRMSRYQPINSIRLICAPKPCYAYLPLPLLYITSFVQCKPSVATQVTMYRYRPSYSTLKQLIWIIGVPCCLLGFVWLWQSEDSHKMRQSQATALPKSLLYSLVSREHDFFPANHPSFHVSCSSHALATTC